MRKRPLLLAACIYVIGIVAAYYSFLYTIIAGVVLVYALGKLLREKKVRRLLVRIFLLASIFLVSFFRMQSDMAFYEREQSQIAEGEIITLQGEIYKKEYKNMQQFYYLKNCTALVNQSYVPCRKVRIMLETDTYPIGQTLVLYGKVNMFKTATNEGGFDMRMHYRCQQIDFSLDVFRVQFSDGKKDGVRESLYQFRKRVHSVYDACMQYGAGILSTMLLGDQSDMDTGVKSLYQAAGISHILAISGLHVSMVGLSLYKHLRRRRKSHMRSAVLSFFVLITYAIMTGGSVSTSRALGMVVLTLVASVLGQGYDMLNGLGAMILVLLFENPMLLWYSGFQFSVVALLGIGVFGTGFAIDAARPGHPTILERMRGAFLSSLSVWLTTLPLVAYYYYEVSLSSVALNLLILPLLKVIFACGIAGGLLGLCWLGFGRVLLLPCGLLLRFYDVLAQMSLDIPGARAIVGKPALWRIFLYYGLMLAFSLLLGHAHQKERMARRKGGSKKPELQLLDQAALARKKRRREALLRMGITGILAAIIFIPSPKKFEIDVLDVGQGDGIYFSTGDASLFLDGGSTDQRKVGEYTVLPFLKSKGVKAIDYWFVSHADADHTRGLICAMENGYPVHNLVVPKALVNCENDNMKELLQIAVRHGVHVIYMEEGNQILFPQDKITCLYPRADDWSADANDLCLAFTYEHNGENGRFRGMFAGDISSDVEQEIIRRYKDKPSVLDVDYYKVNHHGSRYSSCEEWIQALSPEVCTVSYGNGNSYGHPHEEALQRLQEHGVKIERTGENGEIRLEVSNIY